MYSVQLPSDRGGPGDTIHQDPQRSCRKGPLSHYWSLTVIVSSHPSRQGFITDHSPLLLNSGKQLSSILRAYLTPFQGQWDLSMSPTTVSRVRLVVVN